MSNNLDARQLIPRVQEMIDLIIPIAEAFPQPGNFTISLHVKRKKGKATVDAQLKIDSGE